MQQLAALLLSAPCRVLDPDNATDDEKLLSTTLGIRTTEFYSQDERAALVSRLPCTPELVAAIDAAVVRSGGEATAWRSVLGGGPISECALALRCGASVHGAWCAIHCWRRSDGCGGLSGGPSAVLLFKLEPPSSHVASALLTRIGESAAVDMQVYCAKEQSPPQPDSFWGLQYVHSVDYPQYDAYRQVVDGLIEAAVRTHCRGGCGRRLRVLEICGGDGAFAERLLLNLGDTCEQYTLFERNAKLTEDARRRLASFPAVCVRQQDCSAAGDEGLGWALHDGRVGALEERSSRVDVCISSGSVLCSQVGRPLDAERVLESIADSLVDEGTLIATGISSSFLHPRILHRAGFTVVQGSHPKPLTQCAASPGGLEHAWGRFQFLVLRKVGGKAVQTAGKDGLLFQALAGE